MPSEFTAQPNCRAIDVDGKRYLANSQGHITVDNPKHADLIASSFERGKGFLEMRLQHFADVPDDGARCGTCGFNAFSWQATDNKPCSRCGACDWPAPAGVEEAL